MENGFALATELSSRTGWLWVAAEHCSPFGPVPLQNLPPSYELLRPCAPPRYSDPCGLSRLDVSLCIGATGSHVPYEGHGDDPRQILIQGPLMAFSCADLAAAGGLGA